MNAKELADRLNGRQYLEEMTQKEEQLAKENGLVVVFGYSDDNIEFRGAIEDELGCWEGGTYWVYEYGHIQLTDNPHGLCKKIEAIWNDGDGAAWEYKTDIPHEAFNIYEDDVLFCIGIVFSMTEAFDK